MNLDKWGFAEMLNEAETKVIRWLLTGSSSMRMTEKNWLRLLIYARTAMEFIIILPLADYGLINTTHC